MSTDDMRIGQGYDIHRLVEGRRLILGGVEISGEIGLDGHSDADVLAHAVGDALLGAIAAGDLGTHFPSGDERWRDASGARLLTHIQALVDAAGFALGNADATLIAERPRLAAVLPQIRKGLAEMLAVDIERVNIAIKSHDGLGAIGRGEGIAAQAVVLLRRKDT